MSAHRRHKKHHHEEHENHERWLVSGFDMMTLLFAVFVVLFAISSTNVSKVHILAQSLQEALSGPVFSGGRAMMQTGSTSTGNTPAPTQPPLQAISPVQAISKAMEGGKDGDAKAAAKEERDFSALKRRIDRLVKDAGLGSKVSTTSTPNGLRIRLLTDNLLFASGSATVQAAAAPTLERIGGVLAKEPDHPVEVDGHTDDRRIHSSQYPSNWQLSGARAAAVVQRLVAGGVDGHDVSLAGYGSERPVAPNTTAAGRADNRRVEILLTRLHGAPTSHGGDTP